ncbi:VOC family protein, partial [Halorubrum pallidum]
MDPDDDGDRSGYGDREDDGDRESGSDRRRNGARIGRVSLRVADLGETTAFYRDVVGLAVLNRDGDEAVLGVDGTPLLVLRYDPDSPDRSP